MHEFIACSQAESSFPPASQLEAIAPTAGARAIRALYREVALSPKPGLVSPIDSGSHQDMDYRTFLRSLSSLREYFPTITRVGGKASSYHALQQLGIAAEARMLRATNGINTHRGAIFNIGLLCAAAGLAAVDGLACNADSLCTIVSANWGNDILDTAKSAPRNHGVDVKQRYGIGGAREEAAQGFPSVREFGLPVYRQTLAKTGKADLASIQALFSLISHVSDTNLLWRGGVDGLEFAQSRAKAFLSKGGIHAAGWLDEARAIHREFVARRLSPGGSADLLGVTLFLSEV